jgi:hypothetical protein
MMKTRAKYAMVAITLVAAAIAVAWYNDDMNQSLNPHSDRRAADYDHFTFYGYPNFVEISIKSLSEAHLYVEVPDGRRFLIKDLPEEVASKYTLEEFDRRDDPVQPVDEIMYSSGKTILIYRKGELRRAKFEFPEETFKFGARLDGPYLELPVDAEQLVQVFGEPKEWRRPGHKGPQF